MMITAGGGLIGSMKISTVPPHTPGSPCLGSTRLYSTIFDWPDRATAFASSIVRCSMPPPPTVPTNLPSAKTSIFEVECRGTDPLDLITVQRAADWPLD